MDELLNQLQQEWQCPISKSEIIEPVVTVDGHTYDFQSISKWLKTSNKSPVTGLPLQQKKLIPNIALKSLIQKILIHVPKETQKMDQLMAENQDLKFRIKSMKLEIQKYKQIIEGNCQILKSQQKMKKIQMKHSETRAQSVHELSKIIQNLNIKIRSMNKDAADYKVQFRQLSMERISVQKQLEKRLAEKKSMQKTHKQSQKKYQTQIQNLKKQTDDVKKQLQNKQLLIQQILNDFSAKTVFRFLKGNMFKLINALTDIIKENQKIDDFQSIEAKVANELKQQQSSVKQNILLIFKVARLAQSYEQFQPLLGYECQKLGINQTFRRKSKIIAFDIKSRLFEILSKQEFKEPLSIKLRLNFDRKNESSEKTKERWKRIISSKLLQNVYALQITCPVKILQQQLQKFPKLICIEYDPLELSEETKQEIHAYNQNKESLFQEENQSQERSGQVIASSEQDDSS